MKKKLCLYGILFAMSISGCTQAGNDSADVENETMIVNGVDEEKEERCHAVYLLKPLHPGGQPLHRRRE